MTRAQRLRIIDRRNRSKCEVSVGNKISERDSDTLAVYLLNFVKKYSFADEVVNLFFYIIKSKNKKHLLEKILTFEITKLYGQKKLHLSKSAKDFISSKIKSETKSEDKKDQTENEDGEQEISEKEIFNYYMQNRNMFANELGYIFIEDDNVFAEVIFRTRSIAWEDFARIFVLLGEKEIRNVMTYAIFKRDCENYETFSKSLEKSLERNVQIPTRALNNFYDTSDLDIITNFASLKENEAIMFKLFYFQQRFHSFSEIEENVSPENWPFFYSTLTGLSESDVVYTLRKDKPLVFYGLIKKDRRDNWFCLENDVITCVSSNDMSSFFTSALKETEVKPYPIESFSCKESDSKLVQTLLKGGQNINILLYGAPGSGKTEFAKSVINSVGKKVLMFKNDLELDENENAICTLNRISAVNQGGDCVIVVDEADKLLATVSQQTIFGSIPSEQKGPINKMLEDSKNQIIWITNYTNQMDESTKRRFTFSLEFNPMPEKTLRKITESKIADIEMSEKMRGEITDLCSKYKVTGASIENVKKMILSVNESEKNASEEEKLSEIKSILVSNSTLLNGKAKMRENQCKNYDMSVLNTSVEAEKIVKMIENAKRFSEKNKGCENGVRLLFYGVSGTGKTEFARYIADRLEKKINVKRVSDIMNCYVGESEKNISRAFREAELSGDILLFDEADSFFSDRENANYSWERNAVNEFLTQMEEFSGILICTTNLKQILDPAINRRFHILCEFKPLNENGIKTLLSRYFSGIDFTESQIKELSESASVTPGDFGTLSSKLRFMDEDELTTENITKELFAMQKQKKNSDLYERRIGF